MSTDTSERAADDESSTISWGTWDRIRHTERFILGAALLFVALFPWVFTSLPLIPSDLLGYDQLVRLILIWSIFALGFNLLLGQTGLLSFGHAMFVGGAGYAAALFANHVYADPLAMIVVGTTFAAVVAFVTPFILLRLHTVYFAIVTLAIAQMLFYVAREPLEWLTNGINGLGASRGPLLGMLELSAPLPGVLWVLWGDYMYLFLAAFFVGTVMFVTRIRKSPYGLLFKAVRENETRAAFVGLDVWRYKFAAFFLSGTIAGVAGSLYPIATQFMGVNRLHWTMSGDIVMMTVLGGLGTISGPVIGVIVFIYFEGVVNGLDLIGGYWLLTLAIAFTAIVWRFPDGIRGMASVLGSKLRSRGGDG